MITYQFFLKFGIWNARNVYILDPKFHENGAFLWKLHSFEKTQQNLLSGKKGPRKFTEIRRIDEDSKKQIIYFLFLEFRIWNAHDVYVLNPKFCESWIFILEITSIWISVAKLKKILPFCWLNKKVQFLTLFQFFLFIQTDPISKVMIQFSKNLDLKRRHHEHFKF